MFNAHPLPPPLSTHVPHLFRFAVLLSLLLFSTLFISRFPAAASGPTLGSVPSVVASTSDHAGTSQPTLSPPFPLRCTLVTVFSEHKRSLLMYLSNWYENMPWMKNDNYALVIFYVDGPAGARDEDLTALRELAPSWNVVFVPFQYDPEWQTSVFTTPNAGGGPYVNWLLAHDMYFKYNSVSALRDAKYMMRFDDDIIFSAPSVGDPFLALATAGKRVGWKQNIPDNSGGLQSGMFERAVAYAPTLGTRLSDIWPLVSVEKNRGPDNKHSAWRPYLVAGCVEVYAVDVFRSEEYRDFLSGTRAAQLLRESKIWEQEVKTMWMQLSVPAHEWVCIACLLPVGHKIIDERNTRLWFFDKSCDYSSGRVTGSDRGQCTLDPELRFC